LIEIKKIETEHDAALDEVKKLFAEYQTELDENLCFQSFEQELENPLKKYGHRGVILYALANNTMVGCIALQQLDEGNCEMKRLYVQPLFRKQAIGKLLVEAIIHEAKLLGYTTMKLDTLQRLVPAIRLYEHYGFTHTPSYYENPLPNVVYMEKQLIPK
jgi:putative acetyltransferase